jgi:hypothetical protein
MTEEQMREKLAALIGTDLTFVRANDCAVVPSTFHGFHITDKGGAALAVCSYPGDPLCIVMPPFDRYLELVALYEEDPPRFAAVVGMGQQVTVTEELEGAVGNLVTLKPFNAKAIFRGLTFSDDEEVQAVCSPEDSPATTYLVPYHHVVELEPLEERCPEEFAEVAGDTEVNTR